MSETPKPAAKTPLWLADLDALEKAAKMVREYPSPLDATIKTTAADHRLLEFVLPRLPQILRALRAAMEMREKNISDCDAGEDCGPCNNCGVCRWDAAMADAAPDATDTTEKGKA